MPDLAERRNARLELLAFSLDGYADAERERVALKARRRRTIDSADVSRIDRRIDALRAGIYGIEGAIRQHLEALASLGMKEEGERMHKATLAACCPVDLSRFST